jgi:hypothetical protein
MEDFHIQQKTVSNMKELLGAMKQKKFPWQKDVLIWVLHDMGEQAKGTGR